MMKELYKEEDVILLKKKLKSSIVKASLSFGVAILLCGISLFFAKEETARLFKFLDSVVAIVGGWVALGYLFLSVLKSKKRIALINTILVNAKNEYSGRIIDINGPITLASGHNAYDIKIEKDRVKRSVYYDIELEDFDFEIGDTIKVNLGAQNFVYAYEVTEKCVKEISEEIKESVVNEDGTK